MTDSRFQLFDVSLDGSLQSARAHIERERAIAVHDLLEDSSFIPVGHDGGPYRLNLTLADAKLAFHIVTENGTPVVSHHLSLNAFRRILKDYTLICDSHYDAFKCAGAAKFEAIDMGRRAIHDEASELLKERLASKIAIDVDTARRLFTLIYVLLMRNTSDGARLM
ncbi:MULTISPECIES: UPF0262 family protein [Rhizobium]|uniref:Uncharacterized protein (UPF0262 family) n=1 Tax=Rhizobium binae TaxID=1138190 RepID=A0ABV2MP81_9HYPH|nr:MULTISPECIES: UPF0262 family protein [Rhizobium]NKL49598.1 UPF0262 family protein [Rhizobium leguminosarum bv. viciae]MBX4937060.1 UPF0262 family protein [Rhizobium binae]MBX4943710.1 UPF0262 family protein [Rhizobium binae]MBX4979154.1 UPF0262 family protein [Rhizobium binae]MBX4995891.1 UPF0262 family protein [Rhizobium binae]